MLVKKSWITLPDVSTLFGRAQKLVGGLTFAEAPLSAIYRFNWSPESFTKSIAMSHQIHTYTELLQQIHNDLRVQHPEWVQQNGESPTCDSYEARLNALLDTFTRTGSNATRSK